MKNLISIVVPVYNLASCLDATLDSFVKQTSENWECILVDDGSTDQSAQICDNIAETDPRFKVIHTANQGVVRARSTGVDHTNGDWILFVDGDDFLVEDTIRILQNLIAENPLVDIVKFSFKYVDENRNPLAKPEALAHQGHVRGQDLVVSTQKSLGEHLGSAIGDKLYRADFLRQVFSQVVHIRIAHSEDLLFSTIALLSCDKVFFLDTCLYEYVQREGSVSHRYMDNRLDEKIIYSNFVKSALAQTNFIKEPLKVKLGLALDYEVVMGAFLHSFGYAPTLKDFRRDLKKISKSHNLVNLIHNRWGSLKQKFFLRFLSCSFLSVFFLFFLRKRR